ncbi:MAG: hypothetical protein COB15_00870 [Flavobacteriales bacterium]|nr:MAG: hypothetical protein COB15_00870 [Flavobacteriales bacterium]
MIRLLITKEQLLIVSVSKEERINSYNIKKLIGKSKRMIEQNNITAVIIEIENNCRIDKYASTFFNKALNHSTVFPIVIISS